LMTEPPAAPELLLLATDTGVVVTGGVVTGAVVALVVVMLFVPPGPIP